MDSTNVRKLLLTLHEPETQSYRELNEINLFCYLIEDDND